MIGSTLSHYQILEKLGEGGMGEVYRARDLKLERPVAIKLLPRQLNADDEAKRRFMQEARAASALDHPNVCTIHEIDETADGRIFIVMACYDGETVKQKLERGPCATADALKIAVGVARALERAHERGIVHRDVKPANVMVTRDGTVKLMDFGIAKLAGPSMLTRTQARIGTPAYMSPEQVKGEPTDHRADLWSLGVLLYEMVTGQRPFRGEHDQAVLYAILNEDPTPTTTLRPTVPAVLDRLIAKALARRPDARYGQAGEMLAALERLEADLARGAAPGAERVPSVAVLPFRDMSPQRDQDYLCEGMAEELINALVQVEGLRVAARTSAFQFKDKELDVREIGRQLGVRSVLEGSVRRAGDKLRITVQLVNVEDGYHLFSEKYDRAMDDVFAIQDEISRAVVEKLKVGLLKGEEAKLVRRHTDDQEAYNLYLRGRYYWNRRYEVGLQRGIECFREAIRKDPGYARGYAGMADCMCDLGWYDYASPREAFEPCKAAARKALEIEPDLAEAHVPLAWATQLYDWDWPAAERLFRRAIELNPSYPTAHIWYGLFLSGVGRHQEACAECRRAKELEPVLSSIDAATAFIYYVAHDYDRAIEMSRCVIERDPDFVTSWMVLGAAGVEKGMHREAVAALQRAYTMSEGNSSIIVGQLAYGFARTGNRSEALKLVSEMSEKRSKCYASAQHIAGVHLALGDKGAAYEWLERACQERDHWLAYARHLPHLECIRSEPRFQELLRRVGPA